jgi:hypothetical protein
LENPSADEEGTSQSFGFGSSQNYPQRRQITAEEKKWNPQQKGGQVVKNAQELSKNVQQKNNKGKPSNGGGNTTKMTAEQRRQKEQNKGKERQKGADRKMKI